MNLLKQITIFKCTIFHVTLIRYRHLAFFPESMYNTHNVYILAILLPI